MGLEKWKAVFEYDGLNLWTTFIVNTVRLANYQQICLYLSIDNELLMNEVV